MALALSLEKLDGLDPAVAGLYIEKDGKFVLDVDGLEDTSGLKSALEKERKDRKEFEKKLAALKDVDPEEYQRLKKEAEEREAKKLEEAGEFDKLRKNWQEKAQKEKDELKASYETQLAEKNTLLNRLVKDTQVRNAALKAGVIPEDIEDVMTITDKYFRMAEDGTIQVLDDNGEVTPKTADEFFTKDFKERKPKFYAGTGNSGTGAAGETRGGAPAPGGIRTRKDFKSDADKAAWIGKNGLEAFKKLPAQ